MSRFCIVLAVLVLISSSTFARNVHQPHGGSSSHSSEDACDDQTVTDADGNEDFQQTTTSATTASNNDDNSDTTTASTMAETMWATTTTKLAFRKRRAVNSIVDSTNPKSSSTSEEIEGSGGENDPPFGLTSHLLGSSEELLNVSEVNGTSNGSSTSSPPALDSSSSELGSGDEGRPVDISSNEVLDPKAVETQQVDLIKKKLQNWQSSVDNYLYGKGQQRRRKRQQSNWSQLFPSASGASSNTYTSKGSNSVLTAAGNAVGDALKPAMDLMTQGVDLLGNLYSAQLTRTDAYINNKPVSANTSDTAAADQFREQLKQLQTKLSDLGVQLQRVVNSFQQAQLPFLDKIMAGGGFSVNAPSSIAKSDSGKDNTLYGKSKSEKNL